MAEWVQLCAAAEAPKQGEVAEMEVKGQAICLANVNGQLHALDNICPHRQGPLGQGWVEGNAVLCPWHAWAFNVDTGKAEEPERAEVSVFPVRSDEKNVLIQLA